MADSKTRAAQVTLHINIRTWTGMAKHVRRFGTEQQMDDYIERMRIEPGDIEMVER